MIGEFDRLSHSVYNPTQEDLTGGPLCVALSQLAEGDGLVPVFAVVGAFGRSMSSIE